MMWFGWMLALASWNGNACLFLPVPDESIPASGQDRELEKAGRCRPGRRPTCVRRQKGRLVDCSGRELAAGVEAFWQGSRLWIRRDERLEMLDAAGVWRPCDAGLVAAFVETVDPCDRIRESGAWFERVEVPITRTADIRNRAFPEEARIHGLCRSGGHPLPRRRTPFFLLPRIGVSLEKNTWQDASSGRHQNEMLLRLQFSFDLGSCGSPPPPPAENRRERLCAAARRLLELSHHVREEELRRRMRLNLMRFSDGLESFGAARRN